MSGSGVGGFMAGRSSKGCQKLHWEILCAEHLGDCDMKNNSEHPKKPTAGKKDN